MRSLEAGIGHSIRQPFSGLSQPFPRAKNARPGYQAKSSRCGAKAIYAAFFPSVGHSEPGGVRIGHSSQPWPVMEG